MTESVNTISYHTKQTYLFIYSIMIMIEETVGRQSLLKQEEMLFMFEYFVLKLNFLGTKFRLFSPLFKC
jgi:hypothetical protein